MQGLINVSQWAIKWVWEWFLALFLLGVTLPLQILIALAIKLDSPGPVLFVQKRLGRNGRSFPMLKFRTLRWRPGAPPVTNADGSTRVDANDERLTRVGRWLRVGWDEIPQLINVLLGQMAIVGPRPDEPFHRKYYTAAEEEKLSVLPGITGLPQSTGRNEIPWKERIALDVRYIREYSLWLDFKILWRTAALLLFRKGSDPVKKRIFDISGEVLGRVLADVIVANISLAGALALRLIVQLLAEGDIVRTRELIPQFQTLYYSGAPLLSALLIVVFESFGVYSRTRFYARKQKALTLLQAITLTYLLFMFVMSILYREFSLISRGAVIISYVVTLLLSGVSRVLKNMAFNQYQVVRRHGVTSPAIERVLVVGGAGYIGSLATRQLMEQGYHVRVLDASIYGNSAIEGLIGHPDFEFVEGDVRHVESVVRAVKGCQAIVHLGAIVGDPACDLNERITREINTVATKLLLQVARGYGVQRLVFTSTCAVYGASNALMEERSALNPVSLYAQSKADAEKVVLDSVSKDFCPTILRLGTVFGHSPRPRFDLVVNLLVAKAWQDHKITIYNKEQWRPFVHVHDIARAITACLQANPEVVRGEIFNVGSDELNLTLGELAEKTRAALPDTTVEFIETEDRRNYRVSFSKIQGSLGFRCEKSVDDGIREVLEFLKQETRQVLVDDSYDNRKALHSRGTAELELPTDATLARLMTYDSR